jgi:hypothetical protein
MRKPPDGKTRGVILAPKEATVKLPLGLRQPATLSVPRERRRAEPAFAWKPVQRVRPAGNGKRPYRANRDAATMLNAPLVP